jgi:hypothetical protein
MDINFFCFVCMFVGGATLGAITGVAIAATTSWLVDRISAWFWFKG